MAVIASSQELGAHKYFGAPAFQPIIAKFPSETFSSGLTFTKGGKRDGMVSNQSYSIIEVQKVVRMRKMRSGEESNMKVIL